jgi:GT2 family glycosyltransferase
MQVDQVHGARLSARFLLLYSFYGEQRVTAVHFVAVNYRTADKIGPFLDSVRRQSSPGWWLSIVDNSEDPAETARLRALTRDDPTMRAVTAPGNLGYFGGARWGVLARELADWSVVCNTDLVLHHDFVTNWPPATAASSSPPRPSR